MVQCSSYLIGTLGRVLGLTLLAGPFLSCPDSSLDLNPKTFQLFTPLFL